MATSSQGLATGASSRGARGSALRWSATLLVAASWVSAAIFGAYIILFFGGMAARGTTLRWNEALPALYDARLPLAALAIGLHFITGGILLLLGPIQLIGAIRRAVPALHRWLGRAYVLSAGLAGLGGLGFIVSKGTIGGPLMDVGFGLYGALMVLAATLAYAHARAGRPERHRAWAIRLYALTVGSWLYRMEYGFWFLTAGKFGHTSHFTGWFDMVMVFFFYLPNLAVAELFIQARHSGHGSTLRLAAATALLTASVFVIVATWFFTAAYWGPGMVSGLTGAPLSQ
ncbi:DUF2306 domain-containing protein [Flavisphingomonas formosensis]|uniref:DUF2306 domain-containing protein n=1 Tax=Flavisphingomonas formosensis TaxID=861534 RepID=UPI0012F89BAB|nr:DUF2306 domain-containing protein [Sphingomonas formosensis]